MKNFNTILTTISCFLLLGSLHSQKMDFWLDAGLKVQTGFTALYNANATTENQDVKWDNALTSSTKYGIKLGINWNYTGISFDALLGKANGVYQRLDNVNGGVIGDDEISASVTDLYLLFRNAKHKGYFEIGPKYTVISNVDFTSADGVTTDVSDKYESGNLGAVLGFGTYILGPEGGRFSGILGLRFEYGFQDMVSDTGKSTETGRAPVNYGGETATTHPIFAGVVFELNWGIGGVGQARCGERSKFIWF